MNKKKILNYLQKRAKETKTILIWLRKQPETTKPKRYQDTKQYAECSSASRLVTIIEIIRRIKKQKFD